MTWPTTTYALQERGHCRRTGAPQAALQNEVTYARLLEVLRRETEKAGDEDGFPACGKSPKSPAFPVTLTLVSFLFLSPRPPAKRLATAPIKLPLLFSLGTIGAVSRQQSRTSSPPSQSKIAVHQRHTVYHCPSPRSSIENSSHQAECYQVHSTSRTCLSCYAVKHPSRQILRVVEISLNRSQYGGCSTKHGTPTLTQVVYKRFGARSLHRIVIP